MIREAFQFGYVLSTEEGIKGKNISVEGQKKNNFVLNLNVSGWENKGGGGRGQINMDTESDKSFVKKGTLRKEFCTLLRLIKIRSNLIR